MDTIITPALTPVCAKASTSISCTSSADPLSTAPGQQVGGDQGSVVAALFADTDNQRVGSRVGDPVEAALQGGGCRFGVEPCRIASRRLLLIAAHCLANNVTHDAHVGLMHSAPERLSDDEDGARQAHGMQSLRRFLSDVSTRPAFFA